MKRRSDIKVKYVWDHDAGRAKKYAAQLGAAVAPDVAQIWNDPAIVGVVICSETDRHLDLVLAAAKAKKNIYAEKPLGFSAKDSYAMADAMKTAGVFFQTGYFMRSEPIMQFLKQQVDSAAFGKITRIRGCNAHNGALGGWFDKDYRWMADPKQSGIGGFGDLGTHSLDLMLWMMNEPVDRVSAVTSPGLARYEGCDELGEGILVFRGGAIGSLASSWDDVANPVSLEISGTEGHATVMNGKLYFQSKKVKGADGKQPWTELPPARPHALDAFLDAVAGKKDVALVTAPEAAYRAAVMQALYDAAKGQNWAKVQQPGE
jgi:predicted dehydrogenase